MAELEVGSLIPEFEIVNQDGSVVKSQSLKGKWTVLYFYPKDNTPGCSQEAVEFSDHKEELEKIGVKVLGVSKDSVSSHKKFIEKKELKIELLSSEGNNMADNYGVCQLKKNYGKEYIGIVRTTYIISPELKVTEVWKKVKVKGHVEEVVAKVKELAVK